MWLLGFECHGSRARSAGVHGANALSVCRSSIHFEGMAHPKGLMFVCLVLVCAVLGVSQ